MEKSFDHFLLDITQASSFEEIEVIQTLWSGYGKISRYQLTHGNYNSLVVKYIDGVKPNAHPRGWDTNISHQRKIRSYQIETDWYEQWSHYCDDNCKVPLFMGALKEEGRRWIVMEDLNDNYPLRKQNISLNEIEVCLKWLAYFHATFLNQSPTQLWPIGTYWHLATRPDELEQMTHLKLKEKAGLIDSRLNSARYQTFVHGDAKLANFCFSQAGGKVAAVDFQYVGRGCGMKDVAYFLGSCLSGERCELHEAQLLGTYFAELEKALTEKDINVNFNDLEQEWRQLYPFACADFMRFLLGWMPTHQKINDYSRKKIAAVLISL